VSKSPRPSGAEIIKVLVRDFDFQVVRQKGSHVILRKFVYGKKVVTVVPMHKEVKIGTLFGILELGKVSKDEFLKKLEQ
jgi:predicted RNA binding protein YcfA (HicA-like mRNA interferase family)